MKGSTKLYRGDGTESAERSEVSSNIIIELNVQTCCTGLRAENYLKLSKKLRLIVNWIAVSALGFTAKRKEKE